MFSRLREPFGKAGLIVAIVALLAATVGGAYAANKRIHKKGQAGLNKKQKKQVRNISKAEAKKYANSNPGPAGPQGPAGNDGQNGSNGANGADGENGEDGEDGADGKSVEISGTAPGCGEPGGATVAIEGGESPQEICNGEDGEDGEDGETGFTETLPSEKTETGSWAMPAGATAMAAVSFPIPLASEFSIATSKYIAKGGTVPAECENEAHEGTAGPDNPEADPGYFCIYAAAGAVEESALAIRKAGKDSGTLAGLGTSKAGSVLVPLKTVTIGAGGFFGGTWAVTAP